MISLDMDRCSTIEAHVSCNANFPVNSLLGRESVFPLPLEKPKNSQIHKVPRAARKPQNCKIPYKFPC